MGPRALCAWGLALALAALAVPARAAAPAHVTAELRLSADGARPGGTLLVGVLFKMQPGWHVYWKHPGDAGLATSIDLALPEGFKVGPILWPTPERFTQPGGVAGFGYAKEVLLTIPVEVPATFEPGTPVAIRAAVAWLACKDACVPGAAVLEATLPVETDPDPANADLFETWARRVPVDASVPEAPASAEVTGGLGAGGEAGRITVLVRWRVVPADVAFFPAPPPELVVENVEVRTEGRATRIGLTVRVLRGRELRKPLLECVVGYRAAEDERRGVRVVIPLPALLAADEGKASD